MPTYANVPAKNRKGKQPKIFVLDTNIILHDYKAIGKFQDNDVVLPIAVIEELDKFKEDGTLQKLAEQYGVQDALITD